MIHEVVIETVSVGPTQRKIINNRILPFGRIRQLWSPLSELEGKTRKKISLKKDVCSLAGYGRFGARCPKCEENMRRKNGVKIKRHIVMPRNFSSII